MPEHPDGRVCGSEWEAATINQSDAGDSVPRAGISIVPARRRYRVTYHTPKKSMVTAVQKVCLNPTASAFPALSVRL